MGAVIWLLEIRKSDGTVDAGESGHIAAPDEASANLLGWLLYCEALEEDVDIADYTVTAVDALADMFIRHHTDEVAS